MARMRTWARDELYPSYYVNALDAHVSTLAANLKIVKASSTSVTVPAGPDDAQVNLAIEGRWRLITADVTRAHPGGGSGTYTVWAVAADNDVVGTPDPNTDLTDYSFDLRITDGSDPTGVGVDLFVKIGEVVWSGAAITAVRQTRSLVSGAMLEEGALHGSDGDVLAVRQSDGSFKFLFAANMATQAELDAAIATEQGARAAADATESAARAAGDVNNPSAGQKAALAGTSGTPASGNKYVTNADVRNTNARVPTAHAASHSPGGSDALLLSAINVSDLYANRPAASTDLAGTFFYAFDKGILYRCDGGGTVSNPGPPVWVVVSADPGAVRSSLPSGPVNMQECLLDPDGTGRFVWHLRYDTTLTDMWKWRYVGGSPWMNAVDGSGAISNSNGTTSALTANSMAQFSVTYGGLYIVRGETGAQLVTGTSSKVASGVGLWASPGNVAPTDSASVVLRATTLDLNDAAVIVRSREIPAPATSVFGMFFEVDSGTASFTNKTFEVVPVRLG